MFTDQISFWIMLTVSLSFAAWFGRRHGKQTALGAGMAASLLAGTWFEIEVLNTPINVTMATAVILLVVYCTHSWREIFQHLNLLDILLGSLTIWHVIVDTYHDGGPLANAATAYGQWMLPYAAGRYAFLQQGNFTKLAPLFAAVAGIISVVAIVESFFGFNLWEWLFVVVDDEVTRTKGLRYDLLYRSIGPTRHPIFLGIVLFLAAPFVVDLISRSAPNPKLRIFGFILLLTIFLGIVSTVSRGPILCVFVAAAFVLGCMHRVARWSLLIITAIAVLGIGLNFDASVRLFDSDGTGSERAGIVRVDDESDAQLMTSSRNRIFVVKIYGPIVIKGGPLGYGTADSSSFPPVNLPGLPTDPKIRSRLGIVDNSYINIGLAFGWIGVALFASMFVAAIVLAWRASSVASTYLFPSSAFLLTAFAGTTLAVALEIGTVFWSFDFAFWVLFQLGTIAAMDSQIKRARQASVAS